MSQHAYNILTSDIEITKKAIDFFMCEIVDPKEFKEIKKICIQQATKLNKENLIGIIEVGYLSIFDFAIYQSIKSNLTQGLRLNDLDVLVNGLKTEKFLNEFPGTFNSPYERRYKASGEFAKFFYKRNLILNVLCGWRYIIDNYNNSVFKIQNKNRNGDYSIGTGFYYATHDENISKYIVVTNKHVLENAVEIKLYTKDDKEIPYESLITDATRDLGFIILKEHLQIRAFDFNIEAQVLSEIITMGYPSIPMAKYAYQIYHKGEINSFIEDYMNNRLFLFSAKTSSGNSGSPMIDKYGLVLGIVTEELFEKDKFYEKGKLPYYAGIPTMEIIESLNENIFIN